MKHKHLWHLRRRYKSRRARKARKWVDVTVRLTHRFLDWQAEMSNLMWKHVTIKGPSDEQVEV